MEKLKYKPRTLNSLPSFAHEVSMLYTCTMGNPSNPDTNRTEQSVHVGEVASFQGLNCTPKLFFGKEEVSL